MPLDRAALLGCAVLTGAGAVFHTAQVRPGATVLDVASVKMLPSRWLERHMPETVHVVPTHPLFGPQSAAQGVAGRQLVICPLRGDQHLKVAQIGEVYYEQWFFDHAARVKLGKTYPQPMVDHHEARDAALAAYERVKR